MKAALATAVAVAALVVAGCGDNSGGGTSETAAKAPTAEAAELPAKFQQGVKIALVRQLGSGDFFQQWLLGAKEQAKALNIDLRVSDARNNNDQQATDLQRAIDAKVDAIIVDHGLASTVNPLIDDAVKAGIPVVAFDVETQQPGGRLDPAVRRRRRQADLRGAREGHRRQGRRRATSTSPASRPLDRRNRGWKEVKQANPGIKQVAQFGEVSDDRGHDTQEQANAVITANPG